MTRPSATHALLILLGTLCSLAGCASSSGGGADSEKLSRTEYDLARDAFQRHQLRPALEHVDRALEQDDDNADAAYLGSLILLGFCARDSDSPDCRFPEAERYARLALQADPEMRDARNALGVILVHEGRPAEAIAVLEPLANDIIYGSPEKAWGNLGWAYLEAKRADEAIVALKRAVAAQPLFCVGHYRLGLAYEAKKEYAAARRALTQALSIEKGGCERLQDGFWSRARVELHLGMEAEAANDLQRCHDLAPKTEIGAQCARKLQALK